MADGDALIDLTRNVIWGAISGTPSSATVRILMQHKSDMGDFFTGDVFVIPKSDIDASVELTGRINDNTIYNASSFYSNLFHPRKALLFGESDTNGFSDESAVPNSEFAEEYDRKLLPLAARS